MKDLFLYFMKVFLKKSLAIDLDLIYSYLHISSIRLFS